MRKVFLFFLFFVCQNAFGQFGIIQDKDGFVNVRKSPEISNNIKDTLHNGHIVFYYIDPKGDWFEIDYEKEKYSNSGYIHKSRFKFLIEFDSIPVKQRIKTKVVFQKDSFMITLTKVPFMAKNNKLQYSKGGFKEQNTSYLEKINNKEIWGTDGGIPKTQYGQISIAWGKKSIILSQESIEDLFEPNFEYKYTAVCFDSKNNTLYISAHNSDGAGGYSVLWIIKNGKYIKRHLSRAYA